MANLIKSRKSVAKKFIERTFSGRKMGISSYVWAFHRITGVVLTFYLVIHLFVLGNILRGVVTFDHVMTLLENNVIVKTGETSLIWVAVFHGLNGLRLIVLDLFPQWNQRALAYGTVFITLAVGLAVIPLVW